MTGWLSDAEIEDFLEKQPFARLGCHADGRTYVVPFTYVYHDGFVYGETAEGLKIKMMRQNPHVCIEVDDVKSLTEWRSVIAWGEYEELQGSEASEAFGMLMDRFAPAFEEGHTSLRRGREVAPPHADGPRARVAYRIRLTEKTGRFEGPES